MAQPGKVLAAELDDLSLVPGNHKAEGKNQAQVVLPLTSTWTLWHIFLTPRNKYDLKNLKSFNCMSLTDAFLFMFTFPSQPQGSKPVKSHFSPKACILPQTHQL